MKTPELDSLSNLESHPADLFNCTNPGGPCPNCNLEGRDDALTIILRADGRTAYFCRRCHLTGYESDQTSTEQRQRLSERGQDLWNSARAISGEARAYLESRHCVVPPEEGHLRWDPRLRHPCGHIGPALVALVTDALTGDWISVHRTWITASGRNAPIESPRLLLAGHRKNRGVIRLWPDDEVKGRLGIAKGIETALVAADGFWPVWAAIDAANLGALPLLPAIKSLTIFIDDEDADRAAARLLPRWGAAGRDVVCVLPESEDDDIADEVGA
jgi:putative DNA primase/helicase